MKHAFAAIAVLSVSAPAAAQVPPPTHVVGNTEIWVTEKDGAQALRMTTHDDTRYCSAAGVIWRGRVLLEIMTPDAVCFATFKEAIKEAIGIDDVVAPPTNDETDRYRRAPRAPVAINRI